jgi:PhnB protein
MNLYPYLFFTNTAREAMHSYHQIFGGQLEIMTASDLPDGEAPPFEAPDDFVIHAALTFGDGGLLMASDDPSGDGSGVKGAAINVTLSDQDDAHRIFDSLAEDGSIDMALGETFWSPLFGTCVDRFGVTWMVNVAPTEERV